ncbi:MAG TPA: VIT domain-containing protein [Polyangiales bacterium]|nr:VIT domain-containing protein [Polyangiales bacterium]
MGAWRGLCLVALATSGLGLAACSGGKPALLSRTQTLAELRAIKRGVSVRAPGEQEREPYPRERLCDGQIVTVRPGGLAWLRRDGGTTLLIAGPARLTLRADTIDLQEGKVFVDTQADAGGALTTPRGALQLSAVRASLEVDESGGLSAYVLRGALRTQHGVQAGPGERLSVGTDGKAAREPVSTWDDWTGGLATTDRAASPAPFGVGTVGARPPNDRGAPRFPLSIRRMQVRVTIEDDFAITEVDQTFGNPRNDVVEGIYSFRTPPGATLQRYGVDRDGAIAWGRVQERAAAREQYQRNVYEGSAEDPGLLEWDAPGMYRARLYPIAARSTRRVVVRYAEWLGRQGARGERRLYVYPMAAQGAEASLPRIEELTVSLDVQRAHAQEVRAGMRGRQTGSEIVVKAYDFVPRADLALELFDSGIAQTAYRSAHTVDRETIAPDALADAQKNARSEAPYLLVPVRPVHAPEPAGGLDLAIVVDTSAATDAGEIAIARAATAALLSHLGPEDRAAVWAGDSTLRPVAEGSDRFLAVDPARREAIAHGLAAIDRGGATDIGAIVAEGASRLDTARRGAVVYIGDGQPTVGELTVPELRQRLQRMPRPVRVYSLGIGDDANLALLSGISRSGLALRVGDAHAAAEAALQVLSLAERPVLLGASVDLGPGVDRVFPRELGVLAADEPALVIGRITGAEPSRMIVRGSGPDVTQALEIRGLNDAGDLQRRWAEARLSQLLDEGAGRAAVVELGVRSGIVTPFTSIYVPTKAERGREQDRSQAEKDGESLSAWERMAGPRRVEEEPAEAVKLASPAVAEEPAPTAAAPEPRAAVASRRSKDEESMTQLLEAMGTGFGRMDGGGALREGRMSAAGALMGDQGNAPGASVTRAGPTVRNPRNELQGSLSDRSVRAVISRRLGQLQWCHAHALARNPYAGGTIELRYIVGYEGEVKGTSVQQSSLDDDAMQACVLQAVRSWRFPKQGDSGISVVTSTFQFQRKPQPVAAKPARAPTPVLPPPAPEPVRERPALQLATVDHQPIPCSTAADLPFDERRALWRERLAQAHVASAVAELYDVALRGCEAPTWRERTQFLVMSVDVLPTISTRVELMRRFAASPLASDVIYRAILTRVHSAADLRELHLALGLRQIDPAALEKALAQKHTPAERQRLLHELAAQYPDDLELALRLLEACEDAGDVGAGRSLAARLRRRRDANTRVRTAIGEYYLRLAGANPQPRAASALRDQTEARRTFGEIVEFAPEDPGARRLLGDLLRAHGWYEEAFRQYETLARLVPDDPAVSLLMAAAAQGLGKTEEAVSWTEKVASTGAADGGGELATTSRALASVCLAWARDEAVRGGRKDEAARLRERARRLTTSEPAESVRLILTWAHPELRPELWSNALGSPLPAAHGDPLLGLSETWLPASAANAYVEVRLQREDAARAARLGVDATLTAIVAEGSAAEKIVRLPISFRPRAGGAVVENRRWRLQDGALQEQVL